MQEEKMKVEHYKQTDWLNLYVGTEGTVINQTGCKLVRNFIDGDMYVGIEAHGKKFMRKLSTLVMETHIRNGSKIPDYMTVTFRDGNPRNCSASNLILIEKKGEKYFKHRSMNRSTTVV